MNLAEWTGKVRDYLASLPEDPDKDIRALSGADIRPGTEEHVVEKLNKEYVGEQWSVLLEKLGHV